MLKIGVTASSLRPADRAGRRPPLAWLVIALSLIAVVYVGWWRWSRRT